MAVIVEDGTFVPGANSYASVEQLEEYALARGIELPEETEEKEQLLIRAMDYIESTVTSWIGYPSHHGQVLSWPRAAVYMDGYAVSPTTIPSILAEAQCDIAAHSVGMDVLPVREPIGLPEGQGSVIKEKVGPIEVAYADTMSDAYARIRADDITKPIFPKAAALLSRLTNRTGLIQVRKA